MGRKYRVRFSATARSVAPALYVDAASDPSLAPSRVHRKSRNGCQSCRDLRVKCDETSPACKRCQRRGIACTLPPKPSCWRPENPWLRCEPAALPISPIKDTDNQLLQWWFERASKTFVLDLNLNPLSLPIMEHLAISPALGYALQSISAGHRTGFARDSKAALLEKRNMALTLCRAELVSKTTPLTTAFFTIMLIGISTPWIEDIDDYGREHLFGARAVLEILIEQERGNRSSILEQILAYYAWWEMSCSFSIGPQYLPPLNSTSFLSSVKPLLPPLKAPFAGCMVGMYQSLALLLRYCMQVLRSGCRDYSYEDQLERELLDWDPGRADEGEALHAEAFQKHGLIILYRVCRARSHDCHGLWLDEDKPVETQIHQCAVDVVSKILSYQIAQPYLHLLATPLLTAAAELQSQDHVLRDQVRQTFVSLGTEIRTNTVFRAKELLEELWALADKGVEITHLELMLKKGWNFSMV